LSLAEGVSHGSSDDEGVCFFKKIGDHFDFIAHFSSSHDYEEWLLWSFQLVAKELKLTLNEESHSALRNKVRYTFGRCVSAVSGSKSIVHKDFSISGERLCKFRIV